MVCRSTPGGFQLGFFLSLRVVMQPSQDPSVCFSPAHKPSQLGRALALLSPRPQPWGSLVLCLFGPLLLCYCLLCGIGTNRLVWVASLLALSSEKKATIEWTRDWLAVGRLKRGQSRMWSRASDMLWAYPSTPTVSISNVNKQHNSRGHYRSESLSPFVEGRQACAGERAVAVLSPMLHLG